MSLSHSYFKYFSSAILYNNKNIHLEKHILRISSYHFHTLNTSLLQFTFQNQMNLQRLINFQVHSFSQVLLNSLVLADSFGIFTNTLSSIFSLFDQFSASRSLIKNSIIMIDIKKEDS